VLLIELDCGPVSAAVDRIARAVAGAIRAEARETDRAVRLGARSFRMLLPETGDRAARIVADRLDRAYLESPDAKALGAALTIDTRRRPATARSRTPHRG
jgi:GGDEF domain-containing protein